MLRNRPKREELLFAAFAFKHERRDERHRLVRQRLARGGRDVDERQHDRVRTRRISGVRQLLPVYRRGHCHPHCRHHRRRDQPGGPRDTFQEKGK